MSVTGLVALLICGLVALAALLAVIVNLTADWIGPVKYQQGFAEARALMSADQARLEAENKALRRSMYALEGNRTRVYALTDGRAQIPAGYHLAKDRKRTGEQA